MVTQSRRLEPAQLYLRLLTLFASRARQGQLSERAFLIFWNLLHKAPVCTQVRPSMLEKLLCEGGLKHARVASCHEPSMHVAYNTHFFEQPLILCTQLAIQFGFFKLLRVCRLGETTDTKHACPISSIWPSANAENGVNGVPLGSRGVPEGSPRDPQVVPRGSPGGRGPGLQGYRGTS